MVLQVDSLLWGREVNSTFSPELAVAALKK